MSFPSTGIMALYRNPIRVCMFIFNLKMYTNFSNGKSGRESPLVVVTQSMVGDRLTI